MAEALAPSDRPTTGGRAQSFAELWGIVTHPAFRIGFLDRRAGRPFDHEYILARIDAETPAAALRRIGWGESILLTRADRDRRVAMAQYRYEEGRMLAAEYGIGCKAWGHPDYPPAQVREFIFKRAAPPESSERPAPGGIVASLRGGDSDDLFRRPSV